MEEDMSRLGSSELRDELETTQQLLLPKDAPARFLKQVLRGEKAALCLLHARHFALTEHPTTRAAKLLAVCRVECPEYLPDEGTRDRDFLVQLLATLRVDWLLAQQKQLLLVRKSRAKQPL